MKRLYEQVILEHFKHDNAMVFLSGPRQCGKTTCSEMATSHYEHSLYLNWDEKEHRKIILAGSTDIANKAGINQLREDKTCIIFDELHKHKNWKQFLKGFYDLHKHKTHIIVTGSSRLNVFKRGGDSLMGRYFPYRIHPLSVAECNSAELPTQEIKPPKKIKQEDFLCLYQHGGYPQPYLKNDVRFSNKWQRLRLEQLVREDIRDGSRIQDLAQLEVLVELLRSQAAQQLSYSNLATKVGVSVDTITRWINVLSAFYYCFTLKPWHKNVSRSLLKEPKLFLWDWSLIEEKGARFENFIASHLLKATHFWTDMGYGDYELCYIRTREQQEVDFLVLKNKKPWFLVEAKYSDNQGLNPHLIKFHEQLKTQHAFQVCFDLPFVNKNCFDETDPIIVPAITFLSQLV